MLNREPLRPLAGAVSFAVAYYILLNLLATIGQFSGNLLVEATVPPLIAASALSALAMAITERAGLRDLGLDWLRGSGRNLGMGAAIGVGGAMLTILTPVALGVAHFEAVADANVSWSRPAFTVALLFCGAAGEEIAFRGFPLQLLIRGYGAWVSVAGMGILFGLLHGFNPGATPLSMANTAGFGILFGFALLRSHDLWLPIGMHFGWNATLPLLGVDLSGFTIQVAGYRLIWKTGDLWSGGTYGPEASLLATGVLVVLFAVVWKIPVSRGIACLLDSETQDSQSVF